MSRLIAIIPARLGSEGIPNKNFRLLAGQSPVDRALQCASDAGCEPIVLTTDAPCPTTWLGAPYLYINRTGVVQPDLCSNTASMRDVVLHALTFIPVLPDDRVCLLQPTQPLRQPQHVKAAEAILETHPGPCCVVSVTETGTVNKLMVLDDEDEHAVVPALSLDAFVERRQDGRLTYRRDGTVYLWRRHETTWTPPWLRLVIPAEESCALDTPLDWELAEWRVQKRDAVGRRTG